MDCATCQDERWVCEQHGTRWAAEAGDCGGDPEGCAGPGEPCPDCNAGPGFPEYPPGSVETWRADGAGALN